MIEDLINTIWFDLITYLIIFIILFGLIFKVIQTNDFPFFNDFPLLATFCISALCVLGMGPKAIIILKSLYSAMGLAMLTSIIALLTFCFIVIVISAWWKSR